MEASIKGAEYGEHVLAVEPYGVEQVQLAERHGSERQQFTLWLGSNLTIADFALGFLPIALGLSWSFSIASVIIGNLLGAAVVGACAAMGPRYGVPQLMIGRFTFGRVGGYLPALLNYISTIGWFTVNNILGSFGIEVLFPKVQFWQAALFLVIIQGLLAVYGHNLIHAYERVMSIVLGLLFFIASILAIGHHSTLAAYHGSATAVWPMFAIMVAAAFSYIGSWSPYASDYSRYLQPKASGRRIFKWTFWGAFLASTWLEIVGAAIAVLAGPTHQDPIAALHGVMGGFGVVAVIAIILGGTAADALNLYSNALCAGAMNIRLPRWVLAVVASIIGLTFSLLGSGGFEHNYSSFLLMLGYWFTPWLGVILADFYLFRSGDKVESDTRNEQPVFWPGLISFVCGIVISIPFMNGPFLEGSIAKALGGADLSFYVGFVAAAVIYVLLRNRQASVRA